MIKSSIKCDCSNLKNNFDFFAGFSNRGGGSGGRIGVYVAEPYDFRGSIAAFGGSGSPSGGPGTIYIEIDNGMSAQRFLRIDGSDRGETAGLKVFLDEPGGFYHVFDGIELKRKAFVSLQQVDIFYILKLLVTSYFFIRITKSGRK